MPGPGAGAAVGPASPPARWARGRRRAGSAWSRGSDRGAVRPVAEAHARRHQADTLGGGPHPDHRDRQGHVDHPIHLTRRAPRRPERGRGVRARAGAAGRPALPCTPWPTITARAGQVSNGTTAGAPRPGRAPRVSAPVGFWRLRGSRCGAQTPEPYAPASPRRAQSYRRWAGRPDSPGPTATGDPGVPGSGRVPRHEGRIELVWFARAWASPVTGAAHGRVVPSTTGRSFRWVRPGTISRLMPRAALLRLVAAVDASAADHAGCEERRGQRRRR